MASPSPSAPPAKWTRRISPERGRSRRAAPSAEWIRRAAAAAGRLASAVALRARAGMARRRGPLPVRVEADIETEGRRVEVSRRAVVMAARGLAESAAARMRSPEAQDSLETSLVELSIAAKACGAMGMPAAKAAVELASRRIGEWSEGNPPRAQELESLFADIRPVLPAMERGGPPPPAERGPREQAAFGDMELVQLASALAGHALAEAPSGEPHGEPEPHPKREEAVQALCRMAADLAGAGQAWDAFRSLEKAIAACSEGAHAMRRTLALARMELSRASGLPPAKPTPLVDWSVAGPAG